MEKRKHKIIISGGGTGGHVMPALAIYNFLSQKGFENFLYLGGYKGIENKIIPNKNIPYKKIWISGFMRGKIIFNLLFPLKLLISFINSIYILLTYQPSIVIGTGGYVTGPIIFAAFILGFKTLIIEQDIYPGVTSRLLARYADKVCLSFEESKKHLGKINENKVKISGNPIRPEIKKLNKKTTKDKLGLNADKKVILILGGSQGASFINNSVLTLLNNFKELNLQLIWQTGNNDYEKIEEIFKNSGVEGIVNKFYNNMAEIYSAADIVISRAGAISIAEIGIIGIPAILVPYPFAAGDHQRKNALLVAEKEAAFMISQNEQKFEELLFQKIRFLIENKIIHQQMSENWKKITKTNSLDVIFEEITTLIK